MTARNTPLLCFIGFGEAGQAIAAGLRAADVEMSAWDILFPHDDGRKLREAGTGIGVRLADSAADAVRGAGIVVSAVTAASSLEAAQSVKPHLNGQFFLDINSVSPGRKQATANLLGTLARYVDVAVMAPIHPARHQTPMLLAGPHADAVEPILQDLDMRTSLAGREIGAAAAINRQGVQRIINELHKDGIVEFTRNPHHRRAHLVVLTKRGKSVFDNAERLQAPWVNGLAKGLSMKDIASARLVVALCESVWRGILAMAPKSATDR
jgi:DNA-binding MarR family transcriptional regulator